MRKRPDVPDEDIDDIIARASELQEAQRSLGYGTATVEEVQEVAAELDIGATYVERAIDAIREEREVAEANRDEAAERRGRNLLLAAAGVTAVALLAVLGLAGGTALTAARIGPAAIEVEEQGAHLARALDRQIALAPQLVALAGADASSVRAASEAARIASALPDRLQAAATLNQEMAEAIGKVTAEGDEQAQQRLLNLQHEIVGTWNRIDTERGRYDEAILRYERASSGLTGRLALGIGLARPPADP